VIDRTARPKVADCETGAGSGVRLECVISSRCHPCPDLCLRLDWHVNRP
jgi:hypothetical protein